MDCHFTLLLEAILSLFHPLGACSMVESPHGVQIHHYSSRQNTMSTARGHVFNLETRKLSQRIWAWMSKTPKHNCVGEENIWDGGVSSTGKGSDIWKQVLTATYCLSICWVYGPLHQTIWLWSDDFPVKVPHYCYFFLMDGVLDHRSFGLYLGWTQGEIKWESHSSRNAKKEKNICEKQKGRLWLFSKHHMSWPLQSLPRAVPQNSGWDLRYGEGDGNLCNAFKGLLGDFAPFRNIFLTHRCHNVLELEGTLEINWFYLPCSEGISVRHLSFSS